jgi:hypothetical protein
MAKTGGHGPFQRRFKKHLAAARKSRGFRVNFDRYEAPDLGQTNSFAKRQPSGIKE